jgi:hypothetical protein
MRLALALGVVVLAAGCRDASSWSSGTGSYEGTVVEGSFVRTANVADTTRLCLTFDADHLQDGPGVVTTTDGRFTNTPLRPIPQLWHDPLSTLSFGEGRAQNLVYAMTPNGETDDVLVVLSLMKSGRIEARVLRGAPQTTDAGPAAPAPIFAVFTLDKRDQGCP